MGTAQHIFESALIAKSKNGVLVINRIAVDLSLKIGGVGSVPKIYAKGTRPNFVQLARFSTIIRETKFQRTNGLLRKAFQRERRR